MTRSLFLFLFSSLGSLRLGLVEAAQLHGLSSAPRLHRAMMSFTVVLSTIPFCFNQPVFCLSLLSLIHQTDSYKLPKVKMAHYGVARRLLSVFSSASSYVLRLPRFSAMKCFRWR